MSTLDPPPVFTPTSSNPSPHQDVYELNRAVHALLSSSVDERSSRPELMELWKVAQVIADAVHATCNGANEVPELANVQIRVVTDIIKRCSDYLKNGLEDMKDGNVTIVGGVAVVSDGENHAVRPFLHAFKTVAAMFQIQDGTTCLVRDILLNKYPHSNSWSDLKTLSWLAKMLNDSRLDQIVQSFASGDILHETPWTFILNLIQELVLTHMRSPQPLFSSDQWLKLITLVCDRVEATQKQYKSTQTSIDSGFIESLVQDLVTFILRLRVLEAVSQSGPQLVPVKVEEMLGHWEALWSHQKKAIVLSSKSKPDTLDKSLPSAGIRAGNSASTLLLDSADEPSSGTVSNAVAVAQGGIVTELPPHPGPLIDRDAAMSMIIPLLLDQSSSRIWVFGPGGIGKTSFALAAIHDDRVAEHFGSDRGFFSCDAFTDLYDLIAGLELYLTQGSSSDPWAAVAQDLGSRPRMLLVLDEFDVPRLRQKVRLQAKWYQSFAMELQSIPKLHLIFTARDWISTSTAPIWMPRELSPIVLEELLRPRLEEIFMEDAEQPSSHISAHISKVVATIRSRSTGVPLASALLRRLVDTVPAIPFSQVQQLYHEPRSKATASEKAVSLALYTLNDESSSSLVLLAVIAQLQDGLLPTTLQALRPIQPGLSTSLHRLKALGLVFTGSRGSIRVPRTIREYLPERVKRLADVEHLAALHTYFRLIAVDFPTVTWELQLKAPPILPPLPAETFNLIVLLLNDIAESKANIEQMDVLDVDTIFAMARLRRDAASSVELLEHLLRRTKDLSDWQARCYEELGLCHAVQGRLHLAIDRMKSAIETNEVIGSTVRATWCDMFLGQLYALSDPDGQVAASAFEKAVAIFSELRDKPGLAHAKFQLCRLFLNKGMYHEVLEPLDTALDLFRQQGDKHGLDACRDAFAQFESSSWTGNRKSAAQSKAESSSLLQVPDDNGSLRDHRDLPGAEPRRQPSIITFNSGTDFDHNDPTHVVAKNAYYREDDAASICTFHSHLL